MKKTIEFTINDVATTAEVECHTLLVQLLRYSLGLTGTHVGCDTSQCGACTVHVNGDSIKSCTMLAVQADGKSVRTIEGLAQDGVMHPLQIAFKDKHALQCGYCTPGMIMSSLDFLNKADSGAESEIKAWLEGNLCRCTGYYGIIEAVKSVHAAQQQES